MTSYKGRPSSTSHKTLNAVAFGKDSIDSVISDISLNTTLKNVKILNDSSNPSGHTLYLEKGELKMHIADIILKGEKYFAIFDPHQEEDENKFREELKVVYPVLKEILLKYTPDKIRDYIEKTNSGNSL